MNLTAHNTHMEKPLLAIFAGGNNSRLGNMICPYIELRMVSEQLGRRLVFPFAEHVIGKFFTFPDSGYGQQTDPEIEQARTLFGRMVRSAEERLEHLENVGAYQYTPSIVHKLDLDPFDVDILFSRGTVDWNAFVQSGALESPRPILLKDPFPFNVSGKNQEDLLIEGKRYLVPKNAVFDKGIALRTAQNTNGLLDVVFHYRQGDFLNWQNGRHWYDSDLMTTLLDRLQSYFASANRSIHITIISDEALPDALAKRPDITFQSKSLEDDFTRIAAADLAFSNNSTFSRLSAGIGRHILGKNIQYFNLGQNTQAIEILERSLQDLQLA